MSKSYNRDTVNRDTVNRDTVNRDTVNRDTVNRGSTVHSSAGYWCREYNGHFYLLDFGRLCGYKHTARDVPMHFPLAKEGGVVENTVTISLPAFLIFD